MRLRRWEVGGGRWGVVVALACLAAGASAADGWAFTAGEARAYRYLLEQEVAWESAGDRLAFTSRLEWTFGLRCASAGTATAPGPAVLKATVLTVKASHRGPGVDAAIDSAAGTGGRDPLLGHLLVLAGRTVTVQIDPAGQVSATGGAALVEELDRQQPAASPGDPPPLHDAAQRVWSDDALARLWGHLLARPATAAERVPLGPPLDTALERRWSGEAYALALPAGAATVPFTLARDPSPVAGVLEELNGRGSIAIDGGWPARHQGELAFALRLSALTQPVIQRHRVSWTLTPLPPGR